MQPAHEVLPSRRGYARAHPAYLGRATENHTDDDHFVTFDELEVNLWSNFPAVNLKGPRRADAP